MCGGTSVQAPAPDPAQTELEQMQLEDLKQSREDIANFKPFVLQQYGLKQTSSKRDFTDAEKFQKGALEDRITQAQSVLDAAKKSGQNSNIAYAGSGGWNQSGIQQNIDEAKKKLNDMGLAGDQFEAQGYDYTDEQKSKNAILKGLQDQQLVLQQKQQQRIQDALDGKIPPSQALEQQKLKDFQVLKEDQSGNGNAIVGDSLDNAVAKTTSGQQALESLKKTYGSLEQGETNAIIQGEANLPSVYAGQYATSQSLRNPGAFTPNTSAGILPLYASAYQPYQYQQGLQFGADSANATNRTNMITGLISAGLNGAGRAYGSRGE